MLEASRERPADVMDIASDITLEHNENCVRAQLVGVLGEPEEVCKGCGGDIEPERVEAARKQRLAIIRCISCQNITELLQKTRGRNFTAHRL